MRAPIVLAAAFAMSACASRTVIIMRQPPAPPQPDPLEVTIARPVAGRLLVQTNRQAYIALFEIVPDRGVSLISPSSPRQARVMMSEMTWVPVWWTQRTIFGKTVSSQPERYIYAIASEEPLELPDEAFIPGYLARIIGLRAYRSGNPYATMHALSQAFVPRIADYRWGEDAFGVRASYGIDRVVRVYCSDGTRYEVAEEVAERIWCPGRRAPSTAPGSSGGTVVVRAPSRPDSVLASDGQRLRRRTPLGRKGIDRIPLEEKESVAPAVGNAGGGSTPNAGSQNAGPAGTGTTGNTSSPILEAKNRNRGNGNGNAYGHTDDPNVRGRGIENEKRDKTPPAPRTDAPVETRHEQKPEVKSEPKPETHDESKAEKVEAKEERKSEKAEEKVEKREEKQERREVAPEPPPSVETQPAPRNEPVPAPRTDPPAEPKDDAKAEKKDDKQAEKQKEKQDDSKNTKPRSLEDMKRRKP